MPKKTPRDKNFEIEQTATSPKLTNITKIQCFWVYLVVLKNVCNNFLLPPYFPRTQNNHLHMCGINRHVYILNTSTFIHFIPLVFSSIRSVKTSSLASNDDSYSTIN